MDRLIEEEEAELRRSRRKDIDGRVTMQLYEQEAAMLKERRHEVVDKVTLRPHMPVQSVVCVS